MSNAEIGQVLGRSEGAIKSLYHRTLVSLKELLAEHENLVSELKTEDN
jgi:RNA polymerase sigma-70 factor (ECF subfamily)